MPRGHYDRSRRKRLAKLTPGTRAMAQDLAKRADELERDAKALRRSSRQLTDTTTK